MKRLLIATLPLLLLSACASNQAPVRSADYWENYAKIHEPDAGDSEYFHPEGENEHEVVLGPEDDFAFKFIERDGPIYEWIIQVEEDRNGYMIFQDTWKDEDGEQHAMFKKLDFTLNAKEYEELRSSILSSGFLSIRSEFGGSSELDWIIGVRAGGEAKTVLFNGGFPGEPRSLIEEAYKLLVIKRARTMTEAVEYNPKDWTLAPELQPLD